MFSGSVFINQKLTLKDSQDRDLLNILIIITESIVIIKSLDSKCFHQRKNSFPYWIPKHSAYWTISILQLNRKSLSYVKIIYIFTESVKITEAQPNISFDPSRSAQFDSLTMSLTSASHFSYIIKWKSLAYFYPYFPLNATRFNYKFAIETTSRLAYRIKIALIEICFVVLADIVTILKFFEPFMIINFRLDQLRKKN